MRASSSSWSRILLLTVLALVSGCIDETPTEPGDDSDRLGSLILTLNSACPTPQRVTVFVDLRAAGVATVPGSFHVALEPGRHSVSLERPAREIEFFVSPGAVVFLTQTFTNCR